MSDWLSTTTRLPAHREHVRFRVEETGEELEGYFTKADEFCAGDFFRVNTPTRCAGWVASAVTEWKETEE